MPALIRQLALVSQSNQISRNDVLKVSAALQKQASRDLAPNMGDYCHSRPVRRFGGRTHRILADGGHGQHRRTRRRRNSRGQKRAAVRFDLRILRHQRMVAHCKSRGPRNACGPIRQPGRGRRLSKAGPRARQLFGGSQRPVRSRRFCLQFKRDLGFRLLYAIFFRSDARRRDQIFLHRGDQGSETGSCAADIFPGRILCREIGGRKHGSTATNLFSGRWGPSIKSPMAM